MKKEGAERACSETNPQGNKRSLKKKYKSWGDERRKNPPAQKI